MDLGTFLAAQGYSAVELVRSKSGLLEVPAQVGGSSATLYLDTGAARTYFDRASVQRLGLCTRPTDDRAAGVGGGDQVVSYVALPDFSIGPCPLPAVEAAVIDLSHINSRRQRRGDKPFDGGIGSDILDAREAVLDYSTSTLYLRKAEGAAHVLDLTGFLAADGFLAVKLVRSKSGLLDVPARVGGFPATLSLDTGAGRTCLDRASAQRLALRTRPTDGHAVGLGVADGAVSNVALQDFSVGLCSVPAVEAVVTDFSHVNTARRELGDRELDGVLGSDILVARAAVLDYGALTLYLQGALEPAGGRATSSLASEFKGTQGRTS
jgi:predicted aspartyl protease